eukprot:1163102-Rhodomonas_salina.1
MPKPNAETKCRNQMPKPNAETKWDLARTSKATRSVVVKKAEWSAACSHLIIIIIIIIIIMICLLYTSPSPRDRG